MGDVSRKMTTRTWQRPVRPDSERRDPEGGMTDRRDGRVADGIRLAPFLTNDPLTLSSMLDANFGAFCQKQRLHHAPPWRRRTQPLLV